MLKVRLLYSFLKYKFILNIRLQLLYYFLSNQAFLYVRKKVDTNFLIQFGQNLKKIREQKNSTQAQLAIDCDCDVSVISRIERGVVNTSLSNLKLIANALNIDLKQLFEF